MTGTIPATERVIRAALRRLPGDRRLFRAYEERRTRERQRRYQEHLAWSMSHPEDFAGQLPSAYGAGMTERAVEFGWTAAQRPAGQVLDAGSALNHRVTLEHLMPGLDALTILTLAPEPDNFPELGPRYLYGDLRALDLPDDSFDTVVSISTLEHVGLDNARYYGSDAAREDPAAAARQAVAELARVARPGAALLVTVPFGVSQRLDWVRQFDADELDDLIAAARPAGVTESIYRRGRSGWRRTDRAGAAGAEYHGWWAEAVACVRLTQPAATAEG